MIRNKTNGAVNRHSRRLWSLIGAVGKVIAWLSLAEIVAWHSLSSEGPVDQSGFGKFSWWKSASVFNVLYQAYYQRSMIGDIRSLCG